MDLASPSKPVPVEQSLAHIQGNITARALFTGRNGWHERTSNTVLAGEGPIHPCAATVLPSSSTSSVFQQLLSDKPDFSERSLNKGIKSLEDARVLVV